VELEQASTLAGRAPRFAHLEAAAGVGASPAAASAEAAAEEGGGVEEGERECVWGSQACGSVGVGSGGGWAAVSPGLRNGGGAAAFCSRGCISCWSPYSGCSLCILEMQHGMH
jgi:hypothetical protein